MDLSTLRYAKSHEWVSVQDGVATVGITKFAVDQLTDVTYLELPKVGKQITVGAEVGVIESVKSTSSFYSPVAGEVVEVNTAAVADTSLLNEDPYEKGWLMKVKLVNKASLDHLMNKEQYDSQIATEG